MAKSTIELKVAATGRNCCGAASTKIYNRIESQQFFEQPNFVNLYSKSTIELKASRRDANAALRK